MKYNKSLGKIPAHYSYIIGDINSDTIQHIYNENVYITPASCQKVITALVALKTLSPVFKFKTQLFATYNGNDIRDIVIKFSGDPTLTSNELLRLLDPIDDKKVQGKVIIDASAFQTPTHSPNIMIDDIGSSYAQPVSSVNIDHNIIQISVQPTTLNNPPKISEDCGYEIINEAVVSRDDTALKATWSDGKIKVTGIINSQSEVHSIVVSPPEIEIYIKHKINKIMSILRLNNRIQIIHDKTKLPINAAFVNEIESELIRDFIKPAMKISDNLVFDSLYLYILNNRSLDDIQDWGNGNTIFKRLIKRHFDIDVNAAMFVDGSGLSRYNRIQPITLFKIVKQGSHMLEFIDSLAFPGEVNSTLVNRNLASSIRAKTGNMFGMTCLCGIDIESNRAFVITANGFADKGSTLQLIDDFISQYTIS